MSARKLRPAAFLDRDGVLNEDHGYVYREADFHWLAGAVDALARLQAAGYALVVVTNQSGVARGLYALADVEQLHSHVRSQLQGWGVQLDGIYACPHHPQGVLDAYRQDCLCRKPQPGMILQAVRELELDAARSVLFGDKDSDMAAGRAAGVGCCWFIGDEPTALACGADGASPSLAMAVARLLAPEVAR